MNTLIVISVLPIVLLYLGLYKAKNALLPVTIVGLLVALGLAVSQWNVDAQPIFSGMMLFDKYAIAFSSISILSTILILALSKEYFERISSHVAEYYAVILFALAGIIVMVSYHNLSMLFIGIEIMSVSLYILAGIKKTDFASNEAALKYFLMGAFSTGFLLFGITLIYGSSGSFDLDVIRDWALTHTAKTVDPMFYTGIMLMIVGLCFKVGAAPFHFWTPDVYEGSPTLITAFMSTTVKTAGFAAFLRLFSTCFASLADLWTPTLMVITVITLCVGNVTALYQQSFKRMLAFSSISHAGYLLFAIVALGINSGNSVFVYATAYTVASIIAFAVLILVQQQSGNDNFESFNGLGKRNPFLAFVLTVAMLSLAGIPLTAGFMGKFFMFGGAVAKMQIWMVIIAVINAIVSIYYYFKVIIAIYFRDAERAELVAPGYVNVVLGLSVVITLVIGVYPNLISNLIP
ncbi:NADH-quinone oxidoreductase subunit N [Mucilaginibacter myungsuensis]|uniref:NADH-quinone oxidoreductase subunit N n=1 Tax=Mucilaginibacter myungsuensis TaxID=649104 RepID=A0A929KW85_9SPHI|nr:NADH-quinone oxidoreductase subunit N [Mucilaginibacter myungsuensis]MBE9662307.1 NADH-quinone oxidoreductase subunit N [Mucilaginibacter myungsuensis]MDN3599256.1 NADH-quinone oxidoreductase subunit N [Mucilaginibacter myungsuensis]